MHHRPALYLVPCNTAAGEFSPAAPAGDTALRSDILSLALRVERSRQEVLSWYCRDAIAELEGQTASELCAQGQGDRVIDFLERILRDCPG